MLRDGIQNKIQLVKGLKNKKNENQIWYKN
jgi:hypothetical protein